MVDLQGQYLKIKTAVDAEIQEVLNTAWFIKGPKVAAFEQDLADYLGVKHAIGCANGTDALQVAMMALDLKPGDEVIVPAFTYVATAEVIALLRLKPIMIDVDPDSFNATAELIEAAITPRTKAIVPVHLYGQSANMEAIMEVANRHDLYVIEDNAQAIGSDFTFSDGRVQKTGTIGHIGCTSFFPSKNLGCYGDGGAMFTNDDEIAKKIRMVANHGQAKKYHHSVIGVNSRLDAIQAAVLKVKLQYLDNYADARRAVADSYDAAFADIPQVTTPTRVANSTHVFHQYTMKIGDSQRDALKTHLAKLDIPSMIYYPIPLYQQVAFRPYYGGRNPLPITEALCQEVLSLPIHTEMEADILGYIIDGVRQFFK
ncbi:MAG: DegT/DnrJ/EryC1/StrS family aminotransferase [Bacteroidota bacterium]